MGQALSSETHSISGGDGYKYWVGLNMKAFRGCKKTIYRGILLGTGPRWGEDVVVKSFSNIPGTKDNWRYEVVKADITRQMISKYKDEGFDNSDIRVVSPSIVQMDKVSKVNKWLSARKGNSTICQDDWVSVEEFVPGEFRRFSPWNTTHEKRVRREADHLSLLSHFIYMKSQGNFVACDFQGVINEEGENLSFTITDSIVHSLRKEYGPFDQGGYGITEFFKFHKCNRVCREWPIPQHNSPPPLLPSCPLSPPPAFEDIVFPVPRTPNGSLDQTNPWRRSSSAHGSRRRHVTAENSPPLMRISHTSSNMTSLAVEDVNGGRDRSNSSSDPRIQRPRFLSTRNNSPNIFLSPLLISTPPPAYEDCT